MNDDNQLDDFFGLKTKDDDKRGIRETIAKKIQSKLKIRLIPKILSKKERYIVAVLLLVILASVIAIPFTAYFNFTKEAPDYGGKFIEGVVNEPRHINPLLSQANDTLIPFYQMTQTEIWFLLFIPDCWNTTVKVK